MLENTTSAAAPDDTRSLLHTLRFATGEREHLCGVASDGTPTLLRDFARHGNRHLWQTVSLHDYRPRRSQLLPFAPVLG